MAVVPGARWRGRPNRLINAVVLSGLAAFVGATYVLVVVGVGAVIGAEGSPHVGLSVLATAVVALGFQPIRIRLARVATHALHGAPSPYDALRTFSETIAGKYDGNEIPARMSKLLAEGTRARWAQVWVTVAGRLSLAATWPGAEPTLDPPKPMAGAKDGSGPDRRALYVRHDGEVLGVLRLAERPDRPMTSVEERLFAGLAAQAGLVLRAVQLRAQLSLRLVELSERAEQLRRSRLRLIAAQHSERTKLERDIHDGAQQHLVALAVNLRLALTLIGKSPTRVSRLLCEQVVAAQTAIETLEELSHGIYPRRLIDEGLAPALRAATADGPLRVVVSTRSDERASADVEVALYFCCMEALQNAAKHAGATQACVELDVAANGAVRLTVVDDGRGFDPRQVRMGAGLANMRDRIDAVDGRLDLRSAPGDGARLDIRVPARPITSKAG